MRRSFFELASTLSLVDPNTEERTHLESLIDRDLGSVEDQNDFFKYSKEWKLAPWSYSQLKNLRFLSKLESSVQELFKEQYDIVLAQNQKRNETARALLQRFVSENIDVIILKGNYLAHSVYDEVGYKRMNDFDILIHKEDWDRIQTIYLEMGYIPLGFGWSGEKEKPAKFSHVGMSFISPDLSCIIGSQWGLKSPTTVYKDCISEAWRTSLAFDFLGVPVKALSTEFNLLHLILHMGIYKCGIRDCMDVFNLLRKENIDTNKMISLLERSNAKEKAMFTLRIASLSAHECAKELLSKLEANKNHFIVRRLNRRLELHAKTGDYQNAYNDYFQDIEKDVIYFNLFPEFHRKFYFYLKVLKLIYFPERKYVLKLNDYPPETKGFNVFFRRFTTPCRIFALIAQEIGWKFTMLLFVKLGIDLLFSLKNYVIKKTSYFDFLKSRNIDPREIEKVVKNIQ